MRDSSRSTSVPRRSAGTAGWPLLTPAGRPEGGKTDVHTRGPDAVGLCVNLHTGSGTWSLPEQGGSSFPSRRASATCVPCPRESREEQLRAATPAARSALCLPCTCGNTWTRRRGSRWEGVICFPFDWQQGEISKG